MCGGVQRCLSRVKERLGSLSMECGLATSEFVLSFRIIVSEDQLLTYWQLDPAKFDCRSENASVIQVGWRCRLRVRRISSEYTTKYKLANAMLTCRTIGPVPSALQHMPTIPKCSAESLVNLSNVCGVSRSQSE